MRTKNLIVEENLDEFYRWLENNDFEVEDIVAYITSITNNYYWINVESTWGPIGFTWDWDTELDPEQYPNRWKQIAHVLSTGLDIDNPAREPEGPNKGQEGYEHSERNEEDIALEIRNTPIKGGYGHFNPTTLQHTIIPKLPDGFRILQLKNTFTTAKSNYIEVQRSDWCNLTEINNLVRNGQSIKIDLVGANLSSNSKNIISNAKNTGTTGTLAGAYVHIKGDLSNCTAGWLEGHRDDSIGSWTSHHTIILDDDNKYIDENNKGLQIPLSLQTTSQFYYPNPNEVFDIRNWYLQNDFSKKNYLILLAESKKYHINWKFVNDIWSSEGRVVISPWSGLDLNPYNYVKHIGYISKPKEEGRTSSTVTIDLTGSDGNVREDSLFQIYAGNYGKDLSGADIKQYDTQLYNPINYIGEVNSITAWNPFCLVKDDDSWPEFNQSLVSKLVPTNRNEWNGAYGAEFMYGAYLYITKPSPYTIDCTGLTHLSLFNRARYVINNYDNFTLIGNKTYALELIKLTNVHLDCFSICGINVAANGYQAAKYGRPFYYTLPTMETITIRDIRSPHYYIPADSCITFNHWFSFGYTNFWVQDFTKIHFKFKYIDGRNYESDTFSMHNSTSLYFKPGYGITRATSPEENTNLPINMYEFAPEILQDDDYLRHMAINTYQSVMESRAVTHPFICVQPPYSHVDYSDCIPNIQSDFIYIYKANITFRNYNKAKWNNNRENLLQVVNQFLTKIYPNVKPNDTGKVYTMTFSENIYNELKNNHPTEFNRIITTLKYQIKATSN